MRKHQVHRVVSAVCPSLGARHGAWRRVMCEANAELKGAVIDEVQPTASPAANGTARSTAERWHVPSAVCHERS